MAERERKATFAPEYIRDISEHVYRQALVRDSGADAPERMIAKDKDNGEKLRNRAGAYDSLTRIYLGVLGIEPHLRTEPAQVKDTGNDL